MPGAVLLCIAVLALIAAALGRSARAHALVETRARVLELLSRALRQQRWIPELFNSLAVDLPSKRASEMHAVAAALHTGESLSEALARARTILPKPWPQLVAAVEGDADLTHVLEDEAQEEATRGRFLERMLVALIYPAILIFSVVVLHGLFRWIPTLGAQYPETPDLTIFGNWGILAAFGGAALLWFVKGVPRWMPRPFAAQGERARILRVCAALMEHGVPLDDTLARVRPLAMQASVQRAVDRARAESQEGMPAADALATLTPNPAWQARIRNADSAALPPRIQAAAKALRARDNGRRHRWIASVPPAAIVGCGIVVMLGYSAFQHLLTRIQDGAMPW